MGVAFHLDWEGSQRGFLRHKVTFINQPITYSFRNILDPYFHFHLSFVILLCVQSDGKPQILTLKPRLSGHFVVVLIFVLLF